MHSRGGRASLIKSLYLPAREIFELNFIREPQGTITFPSPSSGTIRTGLWFATARLYGFVILIILSPLYSNGPGKL